MSAPTSSLRRQLILRMLSLMLPLFFLLWVVAYFSSLYFINEAFDRSLIRRTYALADQVEVLHGRVQVDLPAAAREMLAFDQEDLLFHSITDQLGRVIEGEPDILPLPKNSKIEPGQTILYAAEKGEEPVRVAAFALSLAGTSANGYALVQAGETLSRRTALAERAALAIVIPMLLMTLAAAAAIAYGVGKGLSPLRSLRERLAERSALDLSPVPQAGVPAELQPFLNEINSLLRRLSDAVDSQSRFVADAAHQLRTPIGGIRAQAEAAMASGRGEDAQHALHRIADVAQNMGELVQKLLMLARVNAAENTLHLERLDGLALAQDIAREWVPQALSRGVDIGFEAQASEGWLMGDAHLLQELLANLIDNAIRYGASRIKIMLKNESGRVAWCVLDNGPGIPEQERGAVFTPFHRLPGRKGGAGIGLTIVDRIARLHGAAVSLETGEQGAGLTVCVTFPAAT